MYIYIYVYTYTYAKIKIGGEMWWRMAIPLKSHEFPMFDG